jgi:nucleoside-triphosphate--adenylate kinase
MAFRATAAVTRACRALILGPPGGGKGTLSKRLVRDFDFAHISSGDALRNQIAAGTDAGKAAESYIASGALVPDDVVTSLVVDQLSSMAAADSWLLDGFPRTLDQAMSLEASFEIDLVLNLEIPEEEILSRLGDRRVHVASGRSYHLKWNPPKVDGVDDDTGEPLIQRPDDTKEAILDRLETYRTLTAPLVDHYTAQGKLHTFAGTESDIIWPVLHTVVEGFMRE